MIKCDKCGAVGYWHTEVRLNTEKTLCNACNPNSLENRKALEIPGDAVFLYEEGDGTYTRYIAKTQQTT